MKTEPAIIASFSLFIGCMATSQRCAQIYGKSYVILFAQVEEPRS